MKSVYSSAIALAGLVSTVAGHGYISSPAARMPGDAMKAACGQQMFNNQNSDHFGNIQGELQVANGQSDFSAVECNVNLCKGYKFADNSANIQTYTAGQVVPIVVDIRAPHTGTANVSIIKTSSNSMIGEPLISWDVYASVSTPSKDSDKNFDITIPSDLGSECATAGDCVIQWWWDARSIDQTYEACIDFTVGGSGEATPVSSKPAASSAAATAAPISSTVPTATAVPTVIAVPTSTVVPAPTSTGAPSTTVPETFTLDTFIAWLQEVGKSSGKIARRHARQF
ncbi:hypothetical protein K505DRAFT_320920 [Melanomma pulvis-pyrius CBS 109.77]|uniref:Chitin-binding type-4 domain-containing protein n=1 Tax=Melanomma pulvis-pyrius CBS 109.77 TaxID=1314802 RepID=A0A6A6XTH5_9PLEO|nr:hypothetical protein K505DRAFT_320920 [Melanomma pulvis-pyrius CBS 109.77]